MDAYQLFMKLDFMSPLHVKDYALLENSNWKQNHDLYKSG